ncbi:MAG: hypothetical protein OEY28_12305, partial [Nitrospira sp.]|nr:hypothetical protein [Nitrospira sp.]
MRYAGSAVRLMAAVLTLGSLSLVAAGCPEGPQQREATRPARNVSVVTLAPQLMEVQVKLPVTTRPKEVIELRTAIAGTLTGFDFEKGDIVPAGPLPSEVENLSELRPIARSNDKVFTTQLAEAELAFQRAKRANERVVAYGDSTEEQKDAARTQMNLASARIDQLNQQIRNTYVCSPMKGVLTSKLHKKGEFVGSGELIGIVSVLDPIICELFLPESHYSAVKDGDPVDVLFTALQDDGG